MAKNIDYSKIKALASSIVEAIGDEDEGNNPKFDRQITDFNDGGQESLDDFTPAANEGDAGSAPRSKQANPDAVAHEANESEEYEQSEDGEEDDSNPKKRKFGKDASLAMMGSMLAARFNK